MPLMVEVFRTDVQHRADANKLIGLIHAMFKGHEASFDLSDCDRVLRVACHQGPVPPQPLIDLLHAHGFSAEVLPDEPVSFLDRPAPVYTGKI